MILTHLVFFSFLAGAGPVAVPAFILLSDQTAAEAALRNSSGRMAGLSVLASMAELVSISARESTGGA